MLVLVGADMNVLLRSYALPGYQFFCVGNIDLGNGKAQAGRPVLRKSSNCNSIDIDLLLYCLPGHALL